MVQHSPIPQNNFINSNKVLQSLISQNKSHYPKPCYTQRISHKENHSKLTRLLHSQQRMAPHQIFSIVAAHIKFTAHHTLIAAHSIHTYIYANVGHVTYKERNSFPFQTLTRHTHAH